MHQTVTIPARFNGPPDSGNGGYTAGVLAAALGASPAEVTPARARSRSTGRSTSS